MQVPGSAGTQQALNEGVRDILKGLLAAADEPIAGGRHKVFGNHALAVIPQTSTIASHLPRAYGVAWAIGNAAAGGPVDAMADRRPCGVQLRRRLAEPLDGAGCDQLGRARCASRVALPLLLVCEDNGLGISVPTPRRLGRGLAVVASWRAVPPCRGHRSAGGVRVDRGARRLRAQRAPPGDPPRAHRPLRRARRNRRRGGVPHGRGTPRRSSSATRSSARPAPSSPPAWRRRASSSAA